MMLVESFRMDKRQEASASVGEDISYLYDELDKCRNFSQRLTVCDKLLSYIGSGSSRVVFGFNPYRNDIVLKLAKNQKGIAQNEEEGQFWKNDYSCFPKVIETDANSRWIVVERSTGKMTKNLFKQLTGVSFELFMQLVYTNAYNYSNNKYRSVIASCINQELKEKVKAYLEQIWDSGEPAFIADFLRFMDDMQVDWAFISDIRAMRNWGVINNHPVIVDSGLNENVFNQYYRR